MTLFGFLLLLLIAAICGAIGQALAGYSLGGCLISIVVGFIGAYVGIWLADALGLSELFTVSIEGSPFPIFWSIIGSLLFTLVVGFLRKGIQTTRRDV